MKNSLALIGFMGVGKSAVSKALSMRMGKKLVEVDSLIEQRAGKPVSQIFQDDGEKKFRELEEAVIKEVASGENQIIDCGGGVVLKQSNVNRLRKQAVMVWLKANPDMILKRTLGERGKRPLLGDISECSEIQSMLSSRTILYERAADIIVDTSQMRIEVVVNKIIAELNKHANYHS
jgi:shikimate kinase